MTLDLLTNAPAISHELADFANTIAHSLVQVRGQMGGAGSGVIWDRPRLIITNHHVVPRGGAEVVLHDGRKLRARVVRRAPRLDLAALEVDEDLPDPATIGDSDALRVGDLVLALGHPMGERNAPSLGIVAGAPDDVVRLAMTLRPGNSGGALVNARGEVVGIPHLVAGTGLGMAVATRTVRRFLQANAQSEDEHELDWV